ncbi:MAG: hypothetical protein Tsb0013_05950 [Phycisphaerales bacterium]
MTWKKWTLLIILVLLLVGVISFYRWFSASPAPIDHNAAYRAVEERLVDQSHDAGAWSVVTGLVKRYDRELEGEMRRIAASLGVELDALDITHAFLDEAEADEIGADRAGSRELLDWYVASDIPAKLADALALPGARPASLTEQGPISFETLLDQEMIGARRLSQAEGMRMRLAIERGDAPTAAACARTIVTLARLQDAQPLLITLLVGQAIWMQAQGAAEDAIADAMITPELARALLPVFTDQLAGEPRRSRALLEAEVVGFRSTIDRLYSGDFDMSALGMGGGMPPRILWANHKTVDTLAVSYFDAMLERLEAGPATTDEPELPFDDSDPVQRVRLAPLTFALPAIDRSLSTVFQSRCRTGAAVLHMALAVHAADTGTLPQSLGELVTSGVLDELPTDPFAPDGAYRYRLDPQSPGGFVLYSVGPDGADDGGSGQAWPERMRDIPTGEDVLFTGAGG